MEYNWDKEQLKRQKNKVKELLKKQKNLEEKEKLKVTIKQLKELEKICMPYHPTTSFFKKTKYVEKKSLLPRYTLEQYIRIPYFLQTSILDAIDHFKKIEKVFWDPIYQKFLFSMKS